MPKSKNKRKKGSQWNKYVSNSQERANLDKKSNEEMIITKIKKELLGE